ncbi:MAG TPA: hypothetical protein VFU47_02985, partial [Armatimonadota bacterium]|nr:hypothetical protein [Armatimonadota bacterium]
MGEQRRRGGRGRSGKGGRIPRRGEGTPVMMQGERFVSFPLEVTGPIRVNSAVDAGAVERALGETLQRERREAAVLQALATASGDAGLVEVRAQAERHQEALQQLARDLGADLASTDGGEPVEGASATEALAAQRLARLGWMALQRAAYASGDKRIDRVVK